MTPPTCQVVNLHPLVDRWVDRLLHQDLDGFSKLYGPDALVTALSESLRGPEEVRDKLRSIWRRLRGVSVHVSPLDATGDRLSFETTMHNRLGTLRLRHHVRVGPDSILEHGMQLLEFHKGKPTAA